MWKLNKFLGPAAILILAVGALAIYLLRGGDLLVAGPNWVPRQAKSLATLNQMVAGVMVACIFLGLLCVHELLRFGRRPGRNR